jgi:hypothetical protein
MKDLFDIFTDDSALVPGTDGDPEDLIPTADEIHEASRRYESLRRREDGLDEDEDDEGDEDEAQEAALNILEEMFGGDDEEDEPMI